MPVIGIAEAEAGPHGFAVGGSVEQNLKDIAIFLSILVGFGMDRGRNRLAVNGSESICASYALRAVGH